MKIGRVRAGERFVFDHIGGVYQKVSPDKARCIYGKNFGNEEPITPDISVYVIFEDRDKMKKIGAPRGEDISDCGPGMVHTLVGYKEPVLAEIPGVASEVQPTVQTAAPVVCEGTMQIVVLDEDENVLMKIPNATVQQVVAFSKAEGVRLNKQDKDRTIRESFYDYTESTYYVVLGGKYE